MTSEGPIGISPKRYFFKWLGVERSLNGRGTGARLTNVSQERSLFGSSRTQPWYLRSSDPKRPTADVIQDFEVVGEVSPPSLPIRNLTMLMLQLQLLTYVFKRLRSVGGHVRALKRRRSREDWELSPAGRSQKRWNSCLNISQLISQTWTFLDRTEVMESCLFLCQ